MSGRPIFVKVVTNNPMNIDLIIESLSKDYRTEPSSGRMYDEKTGNFHQFLAVWVERRVRR
jgi:hypothetical protein